MNYLVFDTETTGTPKNYKASMTDLENWPRIIQLAWARYDNETLIDSSVDLIKPEGWEMPKGEFWVNNGFTQEKSLTEGISIKEVLIKFIDQIEICNFLIAHNINFDYNVSGAEMIRAQVKSKNKINKLCTMQLSTDFCNIPGPYGPKWPKLEELHNKLFGIGFEGAHDAMNDVRACAKCFFELKKLEVIKLQTS
jgi:DNA polymerase III subunit epsilon